MNSFLSPLLLVCYNRSLQSELEGQGRAEAPWLQRDASLGSVCGYILLLPAGVDLDVGEIHEEKTSPLPHIGSLGGLGGLGSHTHISSSTNSLWTSSSAIPRLTQLQLRERLPPHRKARHLPPSVQPGEGGERKR